MKTLLVAVVSASVTLVSGVIVVQGEAPAQRPAAAAPLVRIDAYPMADGQIVEVGSPEHFFTNPTEARTKQFLSQIL